MKTTNNKIKSQRNILILVGIVAVVMSGIFFSDYLRTSPDKSWPIVQGTVQVRQTVLVNGFAKRPKLVIQIEPNGPMVYAVLQMSASSNIPDHVTFRYSGDPSKEVQLFEETSSLSGGFAFLGLAVLLLLIWPSYKRYLIKSGSLSERSRI
jgi:4-amino-4-deoxy-L-arabinose transferase-like glycosyltransferase